MKCYFKNKFESLLKCIADNSNCQTINTIKLTGFYINADTNDLFKVNLKPDYRPLKLNV